jgi:hypothetical protein
VYARSFGSGLDLTSKNSPKFVLLTLPIELANFTIKLLSVGIFLMITNPYL